MPAIPKLAIPNLYLKWSAFRKIVRFAPPDKAVAMDVFGPNRADPAPMFSHLLTGERGCSDQIAANLVEVMNRGISAYCEARSLAPASRLNAGDLRLSLYSFTQRVIEAARSVDASTLDEAHEILLQKMCLMEEMRVKRPPHDDKIALVVERYAMTRSFVTSEPSGGSGPVMLKVGEHKGQLAVSGAAKLPVAAYTMLTHDPSPRRLWELNWGETVEWLPSPSKPTMSDGRLLLMPKPEELKPKPGRFIATSVLVWNEDAIEKIDPRGRSPAPGIFDERETTWFLSNVHDVVEDKRKMWPGAITVASAEYEVQL